MRSPLTIARSSAARVLAASLASLALGLLVGACRHGRAPSGGPAATPSSQTTDETVSLSHGGRERRYLLHSPRSKATSGPSAEHASALVISLHGGGGRAEGVAQQTGFSALADREGFFVVYPDAVDRGWNDGRASVPSTAARENVDDVGFLTAVLDDVSRRRAIDPGRVFVNGISNGAFMSSRFACERSARIAAIGLVAGSMGPELAASCKLSRPVSVIAFMGTADPLVPYEGGAVHLGPFERGLTVSTAEAMRVFRTLDGCGDVKPRALPDVDTDDGSTVRVESSLCAEGTSVQLYAIDGGGHTWPGGRQYLSPRIVGRVNRDVDATATMWAFFVDHGRKSP